MGVQGIVLDAGGRPIADKVTVKWQLGGDVIGHVVGAGHGAEIGHEIHPMPGLEQQMPAQAAVIMLGRPSASKVPTSHTGVG